MFKWLKRLIWNEYVEKEDANELLIDAINTISKNGFKIQYRDMDIAGLCDFTSKTIYLDPNQDLNMFCSILVHEATHIVDYLKEKYDMSGSLHIDDIVEEAVLSEDNAHTNQERFLKNSYYNGNFAALFQAGYRLEYFTRRSGRGSREWYRKSIKDGILERIRNA